MKRASTDAKKAERRAAILERARSYLESRSFEEIRLSDLAAELGIVKGTLYLYFPTKQTLFASILVDEAEAWWLDMSSRPPTLSPGTDMAASLAGRGLLVRLFSSLHVNIESGLARDELLGLKRWFLDFARRAALDLESRYGLAKGRGLPFIMMVYAELVGAAQLAFPPENVAALFREERELAIFQVDFPSFLAGAVDALAAYSREIAL